MPMTYLACPYWHEDIAVREARVREADACAAALMRDGHTVYSPLSMNHRIKDHCGLHEAPHDFWMAQDLPWMGACDQVVVLCLPGWKESKGVTLEILWATNQLNIPITYLAPRTSDEQPSNPDHPAREAQDPAESSEAGVRPGAPDGAVKLH